MTPHPPASASTDFTFNHLLAALSEEERARWGPLLEPVKLQLGQVIYEPGTLHSHAYFPTTAVVSLLYLTKSGQSAETGVVGNEGVVGMPLLLGGGTSPSSAVVRNAGLGYRLSAQAVNALVGGSPAVMRLMLRYAQALLTQTAQMAVCNRHHTISQQLCRLLLLTLDRLPTNQLWMTQDLVANLLGVRREGVTAAAKPLQRDGLIKCRRGQFEVLDRHGLEQRSCECYAVIVGEYDRLLSKHAKGDRVFSSAFGELA